VNDGDKIIIESYKTHGGLKWAVAQLPNRSPKGLAVRATKLRKLGLLPPATRGQKKQEPRQYRGVTVKPPKIGPLDLGEQEIVRGWLEHFVIDAAVKLQRTPRAVRDALKAIVGRDFEKDATRRWKIEGDDAYGMGVSSDTYEQSPSRPMKRIA
jgi:hypothetical protein